MVADNRTEHKHDQQAHNSAVADDLLWTNKLTTPSQALNSRSLPSLKSRIATILEERFEKFYSALKAQDKLGSLERVGTLINPEQSERAERQVPPKESILAGAALVKGAFDAGLSEAQRLSPTMAPATAVIESQNNQARSATPQPSARRDIQQQASRSAEVAQHSWVVFASQLIGANLKRLGLEPSEIDDIRLQLVREGAASYEELKRLTRLPDSLDPATEAKILEDIRVMMLGYFAHTLQERIMEDIENGVEVTTALTIPGSIANRLLGIPEIDIEPSKLVEMANAN